MSGIDVFGKDLGQEKGYTCYYIMYQIESKTVETEKRRQRREDRKTDKRESMTKKISSEISVGKMEILFLKSHSKIWAAKLFSVPQTRRQVSANGGGLGDFC